MTVFGQAITAIGKKEVDVMSDFGVVPQTAWRWMHEANPTFRWAVERFYELIRKYPPDQFGHIHLSEF